MIKRPPSEMRNFLSVCLVALSLMTGQAAEIHVATTGNDANPGSSALPLATFTAAQTMARSQAGLEAVTVIFHAGTYYLANTVQFTAADSGTAANPVTYRAATGETVVLDPGGLRTGQAVTIQNNAAAGATGGTNLGGVR